MSSNPGLFSTKNYSDVSSRMEALIKGVRPYEKDWSPDYASSPCPPVEE